MNVKNELCVEQVSMGTLAFHRGVPERPPVPLPVPTKPVTSTTAALKLTVSNDQTTFTTDVAISYNSIIDAFSSNNGALSSSSGAIPVPITVSDGPDSRACMSLFQFYPDERLIR